MAISALIFAALCWVLALAWLWQAFTSLRGMATVPDLTRIDAETLPQLPPGNSPDITVVVPACNEEAGIEATLRSLLASTGVRLQIVAINDRSTDRTGEIMEQIAAAPEAIQGPHSLRIIHIRKLPSGWLGKPHAMAKGAQQASAPWLLFTDGDVVFDPRALNLTVRQALAQQDDHFILVPTVILKTWREAAMLSVMNALGGWTIRLWKVADPRARDCIGAGAFNLIRREVYCRIGGFESLRMQVLEDLSLGRIVKRSGFAQRIAVGPNLIRVRWLQGTFGIIHLAEKNAFAVYRYRVTFALLAAIGLAIQIILPLAAIVVGGWALVAGLVTYAGIVLIYQAHRRATLASPWVGVLFAPATAIVLYAMLRSMVLALMRNGVVWRGTLYPLDELRRNARTGW